MDFAMDMDDPKTYAAGLGIAAFADQKEVSSLTTQASYLITDVRLRSLPRDNDRVYAIDKWGIDVYHKLAGFESQPGVDTQVVDAQSKNIYNRYDNRELTPDTPTRKTTYELNSREVDLLIHAGAYADPSATEEQLRRNLVGSTYSLPDTVQLTTVSGQVPNNPQAISPDDSTGLKQYEGRPFVIGMVRDTGKQIRVDASTKGSNMAKIMNGALINMAPGVTPIADAEDTLTEAANVKLSSKDHTVKSVILNNELSLGNDESIDDYNDDYYDDTPLVSTDKKEKDSEYQMDPQAAANYQDELMTGAADQAGVDRNQTDELSAHEQQDTNEINNFIPMADSSASSTSNVVPMQKQSSSRTNLEDTLFNSADEVEETPEEKKLAVKPEITNDHPVTSVTPQVTEETESSASTVRSAAQRENAAAQTDELAAQVSEASAPAGQADEKMSFNEMQDMLEKLKAQGVGQNYTAPDYEAAAKNSPAARRRRQQLNLKLEAQERAQREAEAKKADAKVAQQQAFKPQLPTFDDGPDF